MTLGQLLANIPPHWTQSEVGAALRIRNNLRFPINSDSRESMRGEFPYFGPTGELDRLDHFRVEGEHVLIGEDGDHFLKYGDHPMTIWVTGRYNVNNHAHIIASGNQCLAKWFYYYYMHTSLGEFLTRQGVGRYKLTKAALEALPIALAPLSEQQKIIEILGTWDEALKKVDAVIAAKDRRKRALMQQLLTGRLRLPGFSSEWKRRKFSEFLVESRIPVMRNNANRRLTVCLHLQGIQARDFRATESTDATVYYERKAGQFIYGKQNIHKGALGVIPSHLDGFHSTQDVPTFDFLGACDPLWFTFFVSRSSYYSQLETKMRGTGSKRLAPDLFLGLEASTPSLEEQRAIAAVLATAESELRLLSQQRAALDQQKRGLMQRLLTGKVRVAS